MSIKKLADGVFKSIGYITNIKLLLLDQKTKVFQIKYLLKHNKQNYLISINRFPNYIISKLFKLKISYFIKLIVL